MNHDLQLVILLYDVYQTQLYKWCQNINKIWRLLFFLAKETLKASSNILATIEDLFSVINNYERLSLKVRSLELKNP